MGVVISGFSSLELSEEFLKKIKKRYSTIVIILPDFASRHELKFKGCEVYCRNKLRIGDLDNIPIPAPYLNKYLTNSQLINLITMYERMWLFETPRPSVILELIGSIISFIKEILNKDISVILSRERPHFPFEYCLAVMGTNLTYRCFGTAEYLRPDKSERGSLIFDGPGDQASIVKYKVNKKFISKQIYENAFKNINKRISNELDIESYFKGSFGKSNIFNTKTIFLKGFNFFKKLISNKSPKYMMLRGYELYKNGKNFSILNSIITLTCLSFKYRKFYIQNCIKEIPNQKFILFLGSYQPEETSNPSGNSWHNLLTSFLHIKSQINDKEFSFLYKEHPAIFKAPNGKRLFRGPSSRNIRFYEKFLYNNIKLINHNEDTIGLIRKSAGIVMINGTSMIDATFLGKPTLFDLGLVRRNSRRYSLGL